jgi:hypothetical protein
MQLLQMLSGGVNFLNAEFRFVERPHHVQHVEPPPARVVNGLS